MWLVNGILLAFLKPSHKEKSVLATCNLIYVSGPNEKQIQFSQIRIFFKLTFENPVLIKI